MKPAHILRLIWLLPLTLGAVACFYSGVLLLLYIVLPGAEFASRARYLPHLLACAGVLYITFLAWRGTWHAVSGKAELSADREAKGAVAATLVMVLLASLALAGIKNLVRFDAAKRQRLDMTLVRVRLETFRRSLAGYPRAEGDIEALVSASSQRGLWDTWWKVFPHKPTRAVTFYSERVTRDSGNWAYVNNPKSRDFGAFYIDCTHIDKTSGRPWSAF